MPRPVALALVVAARFGLLLGLALWLGMAITVLLLTPVLHARLERAQAEEVVGAIYQNADRFLLGALGLTVVAVGARMLLDRAAPPGSLLLPLAAMAAARIIAALGLRPAQRALRARLRDANAPASDAERAAHRRLQTTWQLLVTLEACLGLYALYAIS